MTEISDIVGPIPAFQCVQCAAPAQLSLGMHHQLAYLAERLQVPARIWQLCQSCALQRLILTYTGGP